MHIIAPVYPRPLDRLWLRLKEQYRLWRAPKRAASAGTPKGTLRARLGQGSGMEVNPERYTKPRANSEDMQRLHRHFEKG